MAEKGIDFQRAYSQDNSFISIYKMLCFQDSIVTYNGPNPLQLLAPLFTQSSCSYKVSKQHYKELTYASAQNLQDVFRTHSAGYLILFSIQNVSLSFFSTGLVYYVTIISSVMCKIIYVHCCFVLLQQFNAFNDHFVAPL